MLDLIDIRTLTFTNVFLGILLSGGLLVFSRSHPSFSGIKILVVGYLLMSFGIVLIGFRTFIPDGLSIVAANFFVLLGAIMLCRGILIFFNIAHRDFVWITNIFLITQIPLVVYFTYFQSSTNWRISIFCVYMAVMSFHLAYKLFKSPEHNSINFIRVLYITFFAVGLYQLFRLGSTILEPDIGDFTNAGIVHKLAFFVNQLIYVVTCVTISWCADQKLEWTLKVQATVDPLTEIYNRRALADFAGKEISKAKRLNTPVTIISIDIDHFKKINDNYGHHVGDEVLINFAKRVKNKLREYDILARVGGEEFIVLLPNTDITSGISIAEKIRASITGSSITALDNTELVNITASFGITMGIGEDISWHSLMLQADEALYQAKAEGRDRIVSYEN